MAVNPLLVGGGIVATVAVVGGGLYAGGVFSGSSENKQGSGNTGASEQMTYINAAGYSGKWGETYSRYLVDPNKNTKWWSDSYKKFQRDHQQAAKTDKFKDVTATGSNSLNKVCDAAYKAEKTSVKDTGATANDFDAANVWKYCSPAGSKILTVTDANSSEYSTDGTYGHKSDYKSHLVSAKDADKNTWFWSEKQKEFENHTFDANNASSEFQKLKTPQVGTTKKTVREVCSTAYTQAIPSSEENAAYPKKEVFQFCSLSGKEPGQAAA